MRGRTKQASKMAPENDDERVGKHFFWTTRMEEELIAMYKASPCLYDSSERGYGDKRVRRQIFSQMANKIGISVKEVDRRLKSLRTGFTKDLKDQKRTRHQGLTLPRPTSSRVQMVRDKLKFLTPYIRKSPGEPRAVTEFSDDNSEAESSLSHHDEVDNFYGDVSDAHIDIKPVIPIQFKNYDEPSEPEGWAGDQANSFSTAFTSNSDAEATRPMNPLVIETAVSLKEDMVKNAHEDFGKNTNQKDIITEGLHLLESISSTMNNTYNKEVEEEDLWCKYLAKKLRRISRQEVRDDLMLHVDGLVNKALRNEWPVAGGSQGNITPPNTKQKNKTDDGTPSEINNTDGKDDQSKIDTE